jgi:hypothetical protein
MSADTHYDLWTLQMSNWRYADHQEIKAINITVKSGVTAFAPDWETLMRYKRGQCPDEEYTEIYLTKMKKSQEDNPRHWDRLLHYNKMAYMCYCPEGKYCHRKLFVELAKEFIESKGGTVTIHGELQKKAT